MMVLLKSNFIPAILFALILIVGLPSGLQTTRAEEKEKVTQLMEEAQKAANSGDSEKGLSLYREVVKNHSTTTQFGVALFNVGVMLRKLGKNSEAIAAFKQVLQSKVNDKDPGPHLMEAYRSYRHSAVLQIADILESQKKYTEALEYAEASLSTYAYRSWCGTCSSEEAVSVENRIKRLKALAYKQAREP